MHEIQLAKARRESLRGAQPGAPACQGMDSSSGLLRNVPHLLAQTPCDVNIQLAGG
jgi:hypothetical protein